MIDVHTHIGRIWRGRPHLTAGKLVRWMDRQGIELAVVHSIENPEELHYYVPTPYVLKSCRRYPDRLIPFANVDPRIGNSSPDTDFEAILADHVEAGARGFGESLSGLPVDDPRLVAIYTACGRLGLPVTLHLDHLRGIDAVGLPGLRRAVELCPDTVFLAHGPHWWAEISGDCCAEDRGTYPKRPVTPGGMVEQIFEEYENIYGDLSAFSAYNALVRDPDFGPRFLEQWQDRLLFGTDYLAPGQKCPIIEYIGEVDIRRPARRKITEGNARRILKLGR
ncbi:MAG: amidohydrolase family protein [Candidatus Brocadiia bacterium]